MQTERSISCATVVILGFPWIFILCSRMIKCFSAANFQIATPTQKSALETNSASQHMQKAFERPLLKVLGLNSHLLSAFEPCLKTHVSSRTFPRFGAQMRFWNFLMHKQNKAIEHRNIPNAFSKTRKMHPVAPHSPIA